MITEDVFILQFIIKRMTQMCSILKITVPFISTSLFYIGKHIVLDYV